MDELEWKRLHEKYSSFTDTELVIIANSVEREWMDIKINRYQYVNPVYESLVLEIDREVLRRANRNVRQS